MSKLGFNDTITNLITGASTWDDAGVAGIVSASPPSFLRQAVVVEYISQNHENVITNLLVNASQLSAKQRTSQKGSSNDTSFNSFGLTKTQQKQLFDKLAKKDPDQDKKLDEKKVINLVKLLGAMDPPMGSVLARVPGGASSEQYVILFPAFSHISMPVSPGETVFYWADEGDSPIGYWLTRRVCRASANDPNFTAVQSITNSKGGRFIEKDSSKTDGEKTEIVPNFDDGDASDPSSVLLVAESTATTDMAKAVKSYDALMSNAATTAFTVNEPVESLHNRPNDLAFEGANNSHVRIGMDMNEGPDLTPSCKDGGAGMVDIVAGKKIFSKIIKNTRKFEEVDKRIPNRDSKAGNISLKDDKSRVRVSAKSSADGDFKIKFPAKKTVSLGETEIIPVEMKPYVVFKSDEVRIVARKDGSIKIVKEGTKPGVTGGTYSAIIMHADGTIQIDAEKIVMGRNDTKVNGYVKYSEYFKQMTQLMAYLKTTFSGIASGLETSKTPGYNIPDKGCITAANAIKDPPDLKIKNARSKNIFGE